MSLLTPNMGLRAWDQGLDAYDHSQLANNFAAIDSHDHSPGHGHIIGTNGIADGAINSAKILDGSIQGQDIANAAITTDKLADNSVTSAKIQDGAVGTSELADGAITFSKLATDVIPIGTVVSWYRPDGSISPPTNWEICDGRPWSSVPNAWDWTLGNMPDLRKKFILGSSVVGPFGTGASQTPDIGQSGGSATTNLAHAHTIALEAPTTDAISGGYSGSGGNHRHYGVWPLAKSQSLTQTYYILKPGDDTLLSGDVSTLTEGAFTAYDINGEPTSENAFTLGSGGWDFPAHTAVQKFRYGTSFSGDHAHFISGHAHTVNYHSHGGATGTALSTVDTRPPFVGLLQIMRVR